MPLSRASQRLRVLVAAGDPESQRATTGVLEGAGVQVAVAPDGQAAVAMAARVRYDLILLDLRAPYPDAFQVVAAIRAAERTLKDDPVPIVAFTPHAAADRERCLDVGMNDLVETPIAEGDLPGTVQQWADRRPTVLIADDAPEIRKLVTHRLRETYRVVQAGNGREALAQFDRQPISVVLLDLNMPVLDGYATAAAIRRRHDGKHVPIVALTGSESQEAKNRASAAGCTMHLAKPMRLATLVSTVENALAVPTDQRPASPPLPTADHGRTEIDPFLRDLVPGYVKDKRQQTLELRNLIAGRDFAAVTRIAHDLKGTGDAYGIPGVTRLGRALETAGQQRDAAGAVQAVDELDTLLAGVQDRMGD